MVQLNFVHVGICLGFGLNWEVSNKKVIAFHR